MNCLMLPALMAVSMPCDNGPMPAALTTPQPVIATCRDQRTGDTFEGQLIESGIEWRGIWIKFRLVDGRERVLSPDDVKTFSCGVAR